MKKIVGIFFLVLLCILLGLSFEHFDDGTTTLVSDYKYEIGGEYD